MTTLLVLKHLKNYPQSYYGDGLAKIFIMIKIKVTASFRVPILVSRRAKFILAFLMITQRER